MNPASAASRTLWSMWVPVPQPGGHTASLGCGEQAEPSASFCTSAVARTGRGLLDAGLLVAASAPGPTARSPGGLRGAGVQGHAAPRGVLLGTPLHQRPSPRFREMPLTSHPSFPSLLGPPPCSPWGVPGPDLPRLRKPLCPPLSEAQWGHRGSFWASAEGMGLEASDKGRRQGGGPVVPQPPFDKGGSA